MKKLIILSTICFSLFNCSITKKPQFLGIENIQVLEHTSQFITLSANMLFLNPNIIEGELATDGIKVLINDNEIATVKAETFKVPKRKEFSIPLTSKIPTDSLLSDKSLTRLLASFISKTVKVQYKGNVQYKVFGFSKTYKVDKTETIKIKL